MSKPNQKTIFNLTLVENEDGEGYAVKEIEEVLTKDQYLQFYNWFAGQTGGITEDGIFFVFKYDWERFCQNELGIMKAGL